MLSGNALSDAFHAGNGGSNPPGDAGPEIDNGLGALLYVARSKPGFGGAFSRRHPRSLLSFTTRDRFVVDSRKRKVRSGMGIEFWIVAVSTLVLGASHLLFVPGLRPRW